jgi:2-keto-4-pentenoate hydratase/2-oxohepta-3-ene-1,7-dioic acid hydratase in catechol pathway
MRFTRFAIGKSAILSGPKVGVLLEDDNQIVDLDAALGLTGGDMKAFLEGGDSSRSLAAAAIAAGTHRHDLRNVRLLAPIANPGKILCVGMNYADHCLEQGMPIPDEPVIFCKFANAVLDPGCPIPLIPECHKLDFEVELAIVIGKSCYRCSEEDALSYVAGFTTAHDVSARGWQIERNGKQWFLGKAFDGFAPMGPSIVTADELGGSEGVHNLVLKCFLNGEEVQNSSTAQMVHGVEACIAWISTFMTLSPGDVIFTGTPPGVGCFRSPQLWLKDGDEVRVEIEKIGSVVNRVKAVASEDRGASKLLKRLNP